jgi:2,5-dihydroxypyridine 5,6-dioxygenase
MASNPSNLSPWAYPMTPYAAGNPFTYFDTPMGAPLGIVELMPGARNLYKYALLQPGEMVLILTEHTVDPLVIQALAAAAAYHGAQVAVMSVEPMSPGGYDRENPHPISVAAHAEADVVISLGWWSEVHSDGFFFPEIGKKKARFVSLHMSSTAACLNAGARFPVEVFYALLDKVFPIVEKGKKYRVTTKQGTDLLYQNYGITPSESGGLKRGVWRPFPYGGPNIYPGTTDGVLVVEESTVNGVPDEPMALHFKDNLLSGIEGGRGVQETLTYGPNGYYMRHVFMGLNPKVRIHGAGQFEREKHAGAMYMGIDAIVAPGIDRAHPDRPPILRGDTVKPGHAHNDFQVDRPTITIDGQVIVDDGNLLALKDPDVIKVAEQFGPADVILDPNPQLLLPRRYTGVGRP